uniref:McKusick-Kaufman syndrome n=1 Tax=Astatotilapia calliptera TaxID=8154 RepID=A0AAX7UNH5_ASTCA
MSRLSKKSPSVCTDMPLDNTDICSKLHLLKQILTSCFGPTGRLKQVHNNIGGHVVTTSASSVLLSSVSSSQPFINLIKTSILNHVSRFSDCGLFAAVLCLSLIEQIKKSALRESVAIRVNNYLLALCTSYLQREDCGCRVKLDFCSTQNLITLARSVISSKPACVLTEPETLHISKLAVQAFLLTVPCSSPGIVSFGRIVTVPVEGHSVLSSEVLPGLLVEMPDGLSEEDKPLNPLSVVLFSASLAGDISELGDGVIEAHPDVDTDSQILGQLLELGRQVINDEVKLFMCQKVIHPVLQQYLRSHGVIVVERLGIALMEPLTQLTGAQPVATLHTTIPPKTYGKARDLCIKHFGSKTMLHLFPLGESAICTMILCHRNQTMLNELKSKSEVPETASVLMCSQTEYLLGVELFCCALESAARALEHDGGSSLIDLTHAHRWMLPADAIKETMEESLGFCGCGLVQSSPSKKWTYLNTKYSDFCPSPVFKDTRVQPRVLDSFTAKLSALQVAVETANLALDVKYIIQDMN